MHACTYVCIGLASTPIKLLINLNNKVLVEEEEKQQKLFKKMFSIMIHTPTHPDQGIFNTYFQSPVSHSQAEKLANWRNEKKEAN